jgi:hypothetical protein
MGNPIVVAAKLLHYDSDGHSQGETALLDPSWEQIRTHIESMNRHERPSIWLCKSMLDDDEPNGESDLMILLGGKNVFHVSILDSDGDFTEAVDVGKDDDEFVEVWTSDQGFETLARNTIDLEATLSIAQWYFEHGTAKPGTDWE